MTATKVSNFVRVMSRYLRTIKVDPHSVESRDVAAQYLTDSALEWADYMEEKFPGLIVSWETLKEQIIIRYEPVAQEEVSFRALMHISLKVMLLPITVSFFVICS